ncbi:unnamed protein product, partial [Staurois parvus]
MCSIDVALMGTGRWRCWCYTDQQGTPIISALMITVSMTAREERNANNRHFPIYMQSAVIEQ